ncbi:uncharacterized protein METZ01_LOCUS477859, partial [marine metagenome]
GSGRDRKYPGGFTPRHRPGRPGFSCPGVRCQGSGQDGRQSGNRAADPPFRKRETPERETSGGRFPAPTEGL